MISTGNLFHGHEDLINSRDVFLDLSDVMLEDSKLDSLSGPKPFHYSCVLISDILFNDSFNRLYLIKPVVKSHNLTDELGSLWNQALMDSFVHSVKSVAECIIDG